MTRPPRLPRSGPGALLAAALAAGCSGGGPAERPPGSALWIAPESAPPAAPLLARLEAGGIRSLFVDAARLEWRGSTPRLERLALAAPARRLPVTLVVGGEWADAHLEPGATGEALAAQLGTLVANAERAGLLVEGVHFDLPAPRSLEGYGRVLAVLRRRLEGRLQLSAGLARRDLERPGAAEAARAGDFVVCFLYGQRPGEVEDADAWDLRAVEGNLARLEALGRPYLLGVSTVGTLVWSGPGGREKGRANRPGLSSLVVERALELVPGFTLQGVDRQVFEFTARAPARVGDWRLAAGDRLRVVRTATPILEELLRRVGAWDSRHRLGELYYRAPAVGEGLAIGLASLELALAPAAAQPRLELELERLAASERSLRLRVRLRNAADEPTDLAFFDSNYVELRALGGRIRDVEPGRFHRFELLHEGREKGTMRALRDADTTRLYAPLVDGGEVWESGSILVEWTAASTTLLVSARFLLPEGRLLEVAPTEWSFSAAP